MKTNFLLCFSAEANLQVHRYCTGRIYLVLGNAIPNYATIQTGSSHYAAYVSSEEGRACLPRMETPLGALRPPSQVRVRAWCAKGLTQVQAPFLSL